MTGRSRAKREARTAASQAEAARSELAKQTAELKAQKERDQKRAERLLFRSLRASGGGFFATDAGAGSTLGGSGVLG